MAIIVEDGSGVPGANSFISDVDALNYLVDRWMHEAWTEQNNILVREGWLVQAADYLNALPWRYQQWRPDQPMAFPQDGIVGVPEGVKVAQVRLALLAKDGQLIPSVVAPTVLKETKKLDGVGEKTYEYARPPTNVPIYPFLDGLIGRLLQATPGTGIQSSRRLVG